MLRKILLRAMTVLVIISVMIPFVQAAPDSASVPALPQQQPPPPQAELSKLHPDLRAAAQMPTKGLETVMIEVFAAEGADLGAYFVDGKVFARPPFGQIQVFIGMVNPANLSKLTSVAEVQAVLPIVLERNAEPMPYPADDPVERAKPDPVEVRARADELREGSLSWDKAKAFGDGRALIRPMDWFEVLPEGPHKAKSAWDRGYDGEGVTVAVLDDGIDAAHPDLMGTQKIYSSTEASQYNGWPMVFSPFSMLVYFFDEFYGTPYIPIQYYETVHYVDTSITPTLTLSGTGVYTFTYLPVQSPAITVPHTYVISDSMSQSGVVHVGTHPDADLREFVWGEKAAVLVADPNTANVYDTVYVDLDADYDFRDEKPLTKADLSDLENTKNNMVAYRDLSTPPDGIADISGGMLYFIGDSVNVIPASDYMWGASCAAGSEFMCPGNGDLVAFSGATFDRDYSHGTQCASNVVGQGVTNGALPAFRDLPGDGKPTAAVYGMAPGAEVVNVSDIYWDYPASTYDAYMFAAAGYDGWFQTAITDTDAIQITSNSYGGSDTDNDGWEYAGQFVSQIQRNYAPSLQFLFSTGNGAPAYGTTAPPSPATGIGVGASTEFGSTGWDSITDTTQIMNNDVTPFSNRGPGARGTSGVDVVAGGAFAAGAEALNYYSVGVWGAPDGNLSWNSWGGTSRSAPVAMGVLALIYQAYKDANGVWPTHDQAKAIYMSTATDLNYDTFTQGGGSANADRGTAVAGGHYGVYAEPSSWQPGDYRGADYPGFAHIAYPDDVFTKIFTVTNTGVETITAEISDVALRRIGSEEFDFTVTADMVEAETVYGAGNQDNFYKAFNYFIPITATAGLSDTMYGFDVPADTDLMIVRQMFPFDQYDADGDYGWDNRFYLMVYNWQDVNGDGNVWEDKDSNGAVNFINSDEFVANLSGLGAVPPVTTTDASGVMTATYDFAAARNLDYELHVSGKMTITAAYIYSATAGVTGTIVYTLYDGAGVFDAANPLVGTVALDVDNEERLLDGNLYVDIQTETYPDGEIRGRLVHSVFNFGATPLIDAGAEGEHELLWDHARTEIDRWEYGRFSYHRPGSNRNEMWVHDPLDRMIDGLFIGLRHHPGSTYTGDTNIQYRVDFYQKEDVSWLAESVSSLEVAPGASATFVATTTVPAGMEPGSYEAAIEVADPGWTTYAADTSVIPVALSVAAVFTDGMQLGGYDAYDADAPYPNAAVRGLFDWTWRAESGDWRFYFVDVPDGAYPVGTQLLVKDEWDDVAPHTDIDTIVLGPTGTSLSIPEPSFYGPYVLDTVGGSTNANTGGGTWLFNTSSGSNEEWLAAPITGGLHSLLQHNVLFEGDKFDVVFTKTLGTLRESPSYFDIETTVETGLVGEVSMQASLPLNGLEADVFGLGGPEYILNEPLAFVDEDTIEWTHDFTVTHGAKIELWTSSPDISDLDLFLSYCGPTGAGPCATRGSSTTGSANEHIKVLMPEDGVWQVGVLNWSGPAGHFNLTMVAVQGSDLTLSGLPTGAIAANTEVTFTINYSRTMQGGQTYEGLLLFGPPESPAMYEVPLTITYMHFDIYLPLVLRNS